MDIRKFPDPILFKACEDVTVFGNELKVILDNMWDTMKSAKGIGLSANQVGLSLNMFVMEGILSKDERVYVVNPKIIKRSRYVSTYNEGCLSAPGEFVQIKDRSAWVQVQYQDETGKEHIKAFAAIYSVCVQHEIDHLLGISFLQNETIPKKKRKELAKKYKIK